MPAISITCDDPTPPPERNVAVISLAPIVFQGQVIINQVHVLEDRHRTTNSSGTLPPPPPPPPSTPTALISSELELSEDVCRHSDCDSGNKNTTTDTTASSAPAGTQPSEADTDSSRRVPTATCATVARNPSNGASGTKRKVKLRRLGSRQNSKTESDSDEEGGSNVVLDAASRRLKRKTSRAKRLNESSSLDKADESAAATVAPSPAVSEEVVFTLILKPGRPIEESVIESAACDPDPLEILEQVHDDDDEEFIVSSNVFVKTKRRIYTPCADQPGAVIGKDIDTTSSASDRADNEPTFAVRSPAASSTDLYPSPEVDVTYRIISNLPPLPQSPGQQRRHTGPSTTFTKEPSPAIRLMIAKYNQRLSVDRRNSSPLQSSGSCSPVAWRSPVLERRIRSTPPVGMSGQVHKSSSAGNMGNELKLTEATTIRHNDAPVSQLVKGVLKSSSAGILTDTFTDARDASALRSSLACDSMQRITVSKYIVDEAYRLSGHEERTEGQFRKNQQTTHQSAVQRKMRPPPLRNATATTTVHNSANSPEGTDAITSSSSKTNNTLPRITRKYDSAKPPSPRLTTSAGRRPSNKLSLDLNLRSSSVPLGATTLSLSPGVDAATAAGLSDRAQRLKRAKEEFLKMSAGYRSACQHLETEVIWRKNRLSDDDDDDDDYNSAAGTSVEIDDDSGITKSASVGMINEKVSTSARRSTTTTTTNTTAKTHTKTPQHGRSGNGGNAVGSKLPRNAAHKATGHSSSTTPMTPAATTPTASTALSKFGFSTLAQKLRRVKLRGNSKELPTPAPTPTTQQHRMDTVTQLCRQSLMVDVPPDASGAGGSGTTAVQKSGSAQTIGGGLGALLFRRQERAAKLKKSRSIGHLDNRG